MAVATRPRALTSDPLPSPTSSTFSTTTPRFNNFRPLRYQTQEELDRFFGSTSTQRREQRLRVREDGQVYYDRIEKDEWAHLLASASPEDRKGSRRRSSAGTCLTLNSPLRPASPRRESLASESATGCVTPLMSRFGDVHIDGAQERRGRKRSNSALAPRKNRVDDDTPLGSAGDDWVHSPAFKRRQSDTLSPRNSLVEDKCEVPNDRIRISRLPLGWRRLDKQTLDQAFGVESNPLFDLSPNPMSLACRARKPPTLQLPSSNTRFGSGIDALSPTTSSPPRSPMSPTTLDGGSRRGTFGVLSHPMRRAPATPEQVLTFLPPSAGLSSAGMEYLVSPPATAASGRTLRHASSFDTPRTPTGAAWGQRQRWHSADESQRGLRPARSATSLRGDAANPFAAARSSAAAAQDRRRKASSESDAGAECFTALAPRTGARRFDPTRTLDLGPSVTVDVGPMRDPLSALTHPIARNAGPSVDTKEPLLAPTAPEEPRKQRVTRGTGLRTGAHVYDGIHIPCAAIHLHSDPEDNLDPATAASLSAGQIKKLKKKASAAERERGHARRGSETSSVGFARGSRQWWRQVLQG